MCGISSLIILNGDLVSPVILQKMGDAIAHREQAPPNTDATPP